MLVRYLLSIFSIVIISGCASSRGFNREKLREDMNEQAIVTEQDINKALSLKPQLPKPFKIGVFFKEPESHGRWNDPKWHWTDEDKNKILSAADSLKASNQVSDIFVISDATISKTDLKSLRLAAAQHGADALLVVSGTNDLDRYVNGWGWTYIALAPALFVPASVTDSLFMARAAMWDVRNEFLYLTADSESLKELTRPAAFTNDHKVSDDSKVDALDKLRTEIIKMMQILSNKQK